MNIKQEILNSRIEFENKIKLESEMLEKKKIETEKSLIKIKDEVEREIQKEKEVTSNSAFQGTFAPNKENLNEPIQNNDNFDQLVMKQNTGDLSREDYPKSIGDSISK